MQPTQLDPSSQVSPSGPDNRALILFVLLAWALMTIPTFWIMPAMDDWTASAPIPSLSWNLVYPDPILWRPFQRLFRVLAFHFPYPGLVHATNALGHLLSIGLVILLSRRCGGSKRSSLLAGLAYAMAPAVGAVVWSIDSENHTWSNAFGLASAAVLMCDGRDRLRSYASYAGWFTLSMLSALWNEGGIAWFAVAPLLKAFASVNSSAPGETGRAYTRCGADLALGSIGVAAYFTARFTLLGQVMLGMPGARYGVGLNPISLAKHALMLVGAGLSTVDTLALLSPQPNLWMAFVTLILGLPFLGGLLWRTKRVWSVQESVLALAAIAAVVAPFCVMGHVSEMYAQRPAAVLAILLVGVTCARARLPVPSWWRRLSVASAVIACWIGNTHKLDAMMAIGRSAATVGDRVVETLDGKAPDYVCSVCEQPLGNFGYSIYEAPPGIAGNCGQAARMRWGWKHQVVFDIVSTADKCQHGRGPAIEVPLSGHVVRLW